MREIFRKKTMIAAVGFLLIVIGVGILVYYNKIKIVRANNSDNVFGWAWNDKYGWISFNSANCDIDGDGTYEGAAEDGAPAPAGCPSSGVVYNYGVNIDSVTGNFSGYAWNKAEGYIWLAPTDIPPGESGPNPAKLDITKRELFGWARICSRTNNPATCTGGTEGWISLNYLNCDKDNNGYIDVACGGDNSTTAIINYKVIFSKDNVFHGYAWSADIGWLSFNCAEGGTGGTDICVTSNYKVAVKTNVSGWAWNEKYGWFNFNCKDENVCGSHFYGVNIEPITYNLGGYAWNNNVGWLSFEEGDAPDYSFNSHCESTCNATNNCTACYSINDRRIYGWAKILALGDDGWVRLDDDNFGDAFAYGVSLDGAGFIGDFHGYAWDGNNNSNGIGWLSFNCEEGAPDGSSVCTADGGTSDYKVFYSEFFKVNHRPRVINLESPDINNNEICGYGVRRAYLKWEYTDVDDIPVGTDSQTAYQIIFDDDNNPASPLLDTGKCTSVAGNCLINGNANRFPIFNSVSLNYGQHYYWWVRVWDSNDEPSDWATSTLDGSGGSDVSFIIPQHEYPNASTTEGFIWFPENPSAKEEVKFISTTSAKYYTDATHNVPYSCDESHCRWYWEFGGTSSGSFNSSQDASSTRAIFNDAGNMEMSLGVTEITTGYSCTSSKSLEVKKKLPIWIEKR